MSTYTAALTDVFDRGAEKRLTRDEEIAAIQAAKVGDEAATIALIYAYAPTLRNSIRRYKFSGVVWGDDTAAIPVMDRDDARSMAVLGLLEAVEAFDEEKHDRLAGIVGGYVTDSLSRGMATMVPISVPSRTLKRFFGILRHANGDVVRARQIAPDFAMARDTFDDVLAAVRHVDDLDASSESDEGDEGPALIDAARSIWETPDDAENRVLVEAAFEAVTSQEKAVVRIAYGFEDPEAQPDAEVAHRLGLSRQKAQRLRTGALVKMRQALGVIDA